MINRELIRLKVVQLVYANYKNEGKTVDVAMQKPLSAKQLDAAKRQLKGQIAVACDNRESFALDFARSYLHHGKEKDVETLFRRIDGITPVDVQQVAQQVLGNVSMLMYE